MLVYCQNCGYKQTINTDRCAKCTTTIRVIRQINSFERRLRDTPSVSVQGGGTRLVDIYEEDDLSVPRWYQFYFAISNPWRRRWRRGPIWRVVLVLLVLVLVTAATTAIYRVLLDDPMVRHPSRSVIRVY